MLFLRSGLFQKIDMKMKLTNTLTITLTDAKRDVKTVSDKQLNNLIVKLEKLTEIVKTESNKRFTKNMENEIDEELEAQIEDEVQEYEEEA